jgi:hypothetical protein
MFSWFKKKPVDQQIVDNSNDTVYNNSSYQDTNTPGETPMYQIPPRRPPPAPAVCLYTVGNTLDGQTVLRISDNELYSTTTLTMNPASVKQLIRMLNASLADEEEEDDDA